MDEYQRMNPEAKVRWLERLALPDLVPNRNYLHRIVGKTFQESVLGSLVIVAIQAGVDCPIRWDRPDAMGTQTAMFGQRPQIQRLPTEVITWAGLQARGANVEGIYIDQTTHRQNYTLKNLQASGERTATLRSYIEEQL